MSTASERCECVSVICSEIRKRYANGHVDSVGFVEEMVEKFGLDTLKESLAMVVDPTDDEDPRISLANREWAAEFHDRMDLKGWYRVTVNPGLIDMAINLVRVYEEEIKKKAEEERMAEEPVFFEEPLEAEFAVFAHRVENSKNFETFNVYDYTQAIQWGLTNVKELMWGARHEWGTEEQRQWIEDMFEDINFHSECALLAKRDWEGFFATVFNDLEDAE